MEILFVAPPPIADVVEGWMARIAAVDSIFADCERIYWNPLAPSNVFDIQRHTDFLSSVTLPSVDVQRSDFLDTLIARVDLVYVHTVHLAAFLLPYLPCGKIVVDIHGAAPEEEEQLGNLSAVRFYRYVESVVFRCCTTVLVVTRAMQAFYERRYGTLSPQYVVLPIVPRALDDAPTMVSIAEKAQRLGDTPIFLYAGGSQRWQNLSDMASCIRALAPEVQWNIASHDMPTFKLEIETAGLADYCHIETVSHADMRSFYEKAMFGFVLRDRNAVNEVACPTKLIEYLAFGVVPVLKSTAVGDFVALGLQYLTDEEVKEKFIPDVATMIRMCRENKRVLSRIVKQFEDGVEAVRELRNHRRQTESAYFFNMASGLLPINVEIYLFGDSTVYHKMTEYESRFEAVVREKTSAVYALRIVSPSKKCRFSVTEINIMTEEDLPMLIDELSGIFKATAEISVGNGAIFLPPATTIDLYFGRAIDVAGAKIKVLCGVSDGTLLGQSQALDAYFDVILSNAAGDERRLRISDFVGPVEL